ncbi:Mitochondrial substrate carrier family protein [Abeliophyllum distichum]|uniref:Mitochondrial substrate carrier family protein n=1 Tax=Abeliophyllum distichum TaxID=126358 RepID=A0ABD1U3L2_9LAMI
MIAGSVACSLEHMAMFPVDTLNTRMQAITSSCKTPAITLRQSLGSIMKLEGLGGFYRDIDAMGLGAGPALAVYFSVYETCKKFHPEGDGGRGDWAFYASYRTTVVMNVPFTAVHFAIYEASKRGLMEVSRESGGYWDVDGTFLVHTTAGAVAGALAAAAITTPLDIVKTNCNARVFVSDRFSSSSIGDVIQTILKKDEYGGLVT